jgi:hypothetical protein
LKWLFFLDLALLLLGLGSSSSSSCNRRSTSMSMVDRRLHDDLRKIYLHLKAPRFDLRRAAHSRSLNALVQSEDSGPAGFRPFPGLPARQDSPGCGPPLRRPPPPRLRIAPPLEIEARSFQMQIKSFADHHRVTLSSLSSSASSEATAPTPSRHAFASRRRVAPPRRAARPRRDPAGCASAVCTQSPVCRNCRWSWYAGHGALVTVR